ncbi:histidine phosphatase family protein [Proteiniclasticum sp.]|uniref:SixA phosphatase family protein n=1 Tax=Proteiniclasticum sp. TaxID=2053595 RepID=UPI00289A71A1|nr:histidine phosphatase family protein [Proteiniclasticum sp.]
MSIQLILLRHGIAEQNSEDGTDFNRKLTKEGIEKLTGRLPNLKSKLQYPDNAEIWTSPLLRAKETAEILSDSLGIDEIRYYDFVAEGSYDEFLTMVNLAEEDRTIFVVGHQPYLGDWSYELSKKSIPFKKGAAASFTIESVSQDGIKNKEIDFDWYLEPKEMERIDEDQEETD